MTIACAEIIPRIYSGKINKDGTAFIGKKVDVTNEVLKAIVDFIGTENNKIIEVDQVPTFLIKINKIQ